MRRDVGLCLSLMTACSLACGGGAGVGPGGEPGATGAPGAQGPRGEPGPAGSYARIKVVSPADSPQASGEALRTTLASITEASADQPWLVFVEPGVFDLGSEGLRMRPYIHLQGSGQGLTVVRSHAGNATLQAADNTVLRELSVEHTGGSDNAVALSTSAVGFQAYDVVVSAHDGAVRTVAFESRATQGVADYSRLEGFAVSTRGDVMGFEGEDSSVRFTHSSFRGEGGGRALGVSVRGGGVELWDSFATGTGGTESEGIEAGSSSVTLVRSDVSAQQASTATGVRLTDSHASIRDSTLLGAGDSEGHALDTVRSGVGPFHVDVQRSTLAGDTHGAEGYIVHVSGSLVRGGHVEGEGSVACSGAYDDNFNSPAAPACP